VLVFSLILQNILDNRLSAVGAYNALRVPVAIYGYAVRPVILALFLYIVQPGRRYRVAWALVILNAAVYLTAFFSDIAFHFTVVGHFKGGPLRQTCTVVSALLFAYLFYLTLWRFRPRERKESWIPILVTLIIAGAVVMDFTAIFDEPPISFLTMAIAISCVFYYVWLHLQFVREHEEALVTGQRVQQMLSQIKPHFLHNALTLIIDLCDTAPQKAKEATVEFSRYLRGNMESIDRTGPISFEKELEHTKLYLDIEQMRFAGDLQVRYDIACTGFSLPALTVEPLAENAVRHGVREKPDGRGTVVIATRETPDGYEITVTDDGPGFDPDRLPEDGQMHVGIANVRERLRQIVDGSLEYRSAPGEGTAAIIRIPKQ
jgi:signal transduction histidine kinase